MHVLAILILITQLGSPSWVQRETAHKSLQKCLHVAAPYLKAGKKHADAEVASRCGQLFEAWAWETAQDLRADGWPVVPWIDSLPKNYPDREGIIDGYLGERSGDRYQPPDWPAYRLSTTVWLFQELKTGKSVSELRELLNQMADYEAGWIVQQKQSFVFPEHLLQYAHIRVKISPPKPSE